MGRWDRGRGGGRDVTGGGRRYRGEKCVEAFDVGEFDGVGGGGGEAGVLEELEAGEAGGGGVFGFGEFAEALDGHGEVGLGEEAGLFLEELGAELAVRFVLFGEKELVAFIFGEVGEGKGLGVRCEGLLRCDGGALAVRGAGRLCEA